jgi:hypothetical protein
MSYRHPPIAIAGLDVPFPFPAGSATIVLQLRTLFGAPFPSTLTALGETFAGVVENLSGGDRPMFEQAFGFSPTGGNFLLAQGVGSAEGTRANIDTVYQIDADPALSAEEMALEAGRRRYSDACGGGKPGLRLQLHRGRPRAGAGLSVS